MIQCYHGQLKAWCEDCKRESKLSSKSSRRYMKTELTKEEKLAAAFELKCSGILYQPEGCTQKIGTFKDGCGKCGTGNSKACDFKAPIK